MKSKLLWLLSWSLLLGTWNLGLCQKGKPPADPDPAEECSGTDEAKKLYEKSRDKKKYQYDERIKFIEQAVEEDPNYAPANYELGMHWQRRADESGADCEKCEKYFRAVILNCPKYHSNPYFFLGYMFYQQGNFDSAMKYTKLFLDFKEDNLKKYDKLRYDRFLVDAKDIMKFSKFNKEIYGNPVPYDPKILPGISTIKDEYLPFISPDNEIAFFTRRIKVQPMGVAWDMSTEKEFFCFSERKPDGNFPEGEPMPAPPFNTHFNEGGASITIDNKHLYYTVVEQDGNYDIYYSDFISNGYGGGEWKESKSVGNIINSADYWDSQPSISADGKTLYFASTRLGGYGGVDLWKSEKDENGYWTKPVNLGPNINTEGDEKSPFLHWDSKTLYFSSGDNEQAATSHMNIGGFDIFYSRQDSTGKWGKPKNIGYPINTAGNDVGFFVSTDGKYGYFASNDNQKTKGKSVGGYDLYYFELPKNVRPDEVAIIKGKVTAENGKQVIAAVELKDAVTKKITKAVVDSATGEYAVAANTQKKHDLLLVVKKEGNAFSSQLISMKDSLSGKGEDSIETKQSPKEEPSSPFAKSPVMKVDMKSDTLKEGRAFTLNNIYFGPNLADLKEESKFVLDEFINYLKEDSTIVIEIDGHTDNIGNPQDNQNLSADRAFTVFEYLRNNGVPKNQIVNHKGFGEMKPVASNDTEEGRAQNRRTEFLIVSK
ncbi:MAG: OmpA family protein [Bacteroidetes bacterium]|nr:OmpA family protein [Bacteroidota bacterium]